MSGRVWTCLNRSVLVCAGLPGSGQVCGDLSRYGPAFAAMGAMVFAAIVFAAIAFASIMLAAIVFSLVFTTQNIAGYVKCTNVWWSLLW